MKTGKSISELAIELERQQSTKRDFLADSRLLYMEPESNDLEIKIDEMDIQKFPVNHNAHQQLATWADIPIKYYDRMPADLRAVNVNHWLKNQPGNRMVRTLDGEVRAFLSDRYRPLDNFDLAEAILPVLSEVPEMEIVSCELTPSRMYIKALFPRITTEIAKGDIVQSGICISNSEVGKGALKVEPLIYSLICLNGMISNISKRKYHVGKRSGELDQAEEIYRDETREQTDRAFWMQVQDTVRASVDQATFQIIVDKMKESKNMIMDSDPVAVIERVQKKFAFNDSEKSSVLSHLVSGGDLTGYGLMNAITRTSQDLDDYDRSTEFERIGGQIIELDPRQWQEIAVAA